MPRLLVENDWYEPVQPHGIVETVYEAMLLERAPVLFKGFVAVPLHVRFSGDRGHSSPDFALIAENYRDWWLVLLETGDAPTTRHVANQVEVLRAARYGADFTKLLVEREPRLATPAIKQLVAREMPKIFILLGHPPAPVHDEPTTCVGIAEVFQAANGTRILRINGQHPSPPDDKLGVCTRDTLVAPGLLAVTITASGASLPSSCEIEIAGVVGKWTVRASSQGFWLVPGAGMRLPPDAVHFELLTGPSGRLRLVPTS